MGVQSKSLERKGRARGACWFGFFPKVFAIGHFYDPTQAWQIENETMRARLKKLDSHHGRTVSRKERMIRSAP
jgi:hypothetical protein